jgi:hypothetical protein
MATSRARTRYRETNLMPAEKLLAALAEAAASLPPLEQAGLRIVRHDDRDAWLLIPETEPSSALIASLEAHGGVVGPPEPIGDIVPHPVPGVAAAVAALVHATAVAPEPADAADPVRADPIAGEVLVMVEGSHDRLAEITRALAACAPASRVGGFRDSDEEYLVFRVADTSDLASALAGFAAGPWGGAARYFGCFGAAGALVCCDDGRPTKAALRACARIYSSVLAHAAGHRLAFVVNAATDGTVTVCRFELPHHAGAALDGRKPNLKVVERPLVADDDILERLRHMISARGDGYAVRLDRLPALARTRSPESIRDEIARLEAEWQIAIGLQAAQVKLLRFDHTQVPAMVDALRRLPVSDMNRVQYAFSATADFPIGYHYLKFSTRDVQPLQPFIEGIWRTACGGGPIVHWIDPAWARIYQGGGVRSLVMVPEDHVFSPAFYAFRPQDMDRYLEETVDSWRASAHPERGGERQRPKEPIYLFSPLAAAPSQSRAAGKVRLEVLDGADFTAMTGQIGFINDCLLVAERIDVADFIRSGATVARRREVLAVLSEETASRTSDLSGLAGDLERRLEAQLGDYLARLTTEIEALSRFIAQQGAQVEQLTLESDAILAHVADACGERTALRFMVGTTPSDFAAIAEERQTIETSLTKFIAATNDTIDVSNVRLQDARRRLGEMEAQLQRRRP